MNNTLIKWLGGFTQYELLTKLSRESDHYYGYYLDLRRDDLIRDREMAVKHKRPLVDIDRRLKAANKELADFDNKIAAAMSCGLQKHLRAGA